MIINANYTEIDCATCGTLFFISSGQNDRFQKSHETFWCPRGHANEYPGKSNESRLRDEISHLKEENMKLKSKTAKKKTKK